MRWPLRHTARASFGALPFLCAKHPQAHHTSDNHIEHTYRHTRPPPYPHTHYHTPRSPLLRLKNAQTQRSRPNQHHTPTHPQALQHTRTHRTTPNHPHTHPHPHVTRTAGCVRSTEPCVFFGATVRPGLLSRPRVSWSGEVFFLTKNERFLAGHKNGKKSMSWLEDCCHRSSHLQPSCSGCIVPNVWFVSSWKQLPWYDYGCHVPKFVCVVEFV
jgi:hypothetical protein